MQFPPDEPPPARRLDEIDDWIPLKKCVDNELYRVECRNAQWGIFHEDENGFLIARKHNQSGVHIDMSGDKVREFEKGDLYDFTEFHWDIGEADDRSGQSGTAKPLERIDSVDDPDFELLKSLPDARHETGVKHRYDLERLQE